MQDVFSSHLGPNYHQKKSETISSRLQQRTIYKFDKSYTYTNILEEERVLQKEKVDIKLKH